MQMANAKFSGGAKNAAQHFRPRRGQHHLEAMAWWRRLIQRHHQLNNVGIECRDISCALLAADQANTHGLPQNGFELLANVIVAAATKRT